MVADNFSPPKKAIEMPQLLQIVGKIKCYHQESNPQQLADNE